MEQTGPKVSKAVVTEVKNLPYFKKITNRRKRAFLVAYAMSGHILNAAKTAGCDWRNHYFWLERDKAYKEAFEKSREIVGDILESQVIEAALNGDDRPVIHKGAITDRYKHKSDLMRIFSLKAFKPEYRDHNPIQVLSPSSLTINYGSSPADKAIDVTTTSSSEDE